MTKLFVFLTVFLAFHIVLFWFRKELGHLHVRFYNRHVPFINKQGRWLGLDHSFTPKAKVKDAVLAFTYSAIINGSASLLIIYYIAWRFLSGAATE